jgi:putative transcriptional regulator
VIYYFHGQQLPVFLLAAYGKNEKGNLTKDERNAIAKLIPILVAEYKGRVREETMKNKKKVVNVATSAGARRKRSTVGKRIVEGLEQAIAWTRGRDEPVRVTLVQAPDVDVRKVRKEMGLSQTQFAMKFGFPPATLRNWEQGRAHPDAPTRVLLAVIAKYPEAVEDVLRKAS